MQAHIRYFTTLDIQNKHYFKFLYEYANFSHEIYVDFKKGSIVH